MGSIRLSTDLTVDAVEAQPIFAGAHGVLALLTAAAASVSTTPARPWLWLALQGLSTCGLLGLHAGKARWLHAPGRVQAALIGLAAAVGVGWTAAIVLWPPFTGETGRVVLVSSLSLAWLAARAFAAIPLGFALIAAPALAACTQMALGPWSFVAVLGCTLCAGLVAMRNHLALKANLTLRWSSEALVESAAKEQRRAKEAQDHAERAAHSKTHFLAAASHDLRQPVQALQLFADVLSGQPLSEGLRETTDALVRTAQTLSTMMERLFDLARLDAGVVCNIPTDYALRSLLEDTAAGLGEEADSLGMVVSIAGPACVVHADPVLLARVLQNLAVNALRHAGRGRVLLSTRRRKGRFCLLQVWDQGAGIDEADRERVFDEFVQLGKTERDRQSGLGLGLSMVRRICDQSGWKFSIQSRVGHGTVFGVLLPLASTDGAFRDAPDPPDSDRRGEASESKRGLHVLLVEDDADLRAALVCWLGDRRCIVQAYRDADEAIDAYTRCAAARIEFDVVIADHGLPGRIDGMRLVDELSRRQSDLRSILLTGTSTLPTGPRPPAGCLVLTKPVSGPRLWEAVQSAVRARPSGRTS